MNNLLFTLRKGLQGEGFLKSFSCAPEQLHHDLHDKSIAIVGNARSLGARGFGPAIDEADIVIRMHAAPLVSPLSHGSKTDWLALAMPVPEKTICERSPERLLWMAKKRKRVRLRFAQRQGFYLHPVPEWDRMHDTLGAPPTTGIMLIDLVARSNAEKIDLYGFDFFASLSLSGRRNADQVPHDFAAEKAFVETLMDHDKRVTLNL
jgi:hypothetical protein